MSKEKIGLLLGLFLFILFASIQVFPSNLKASLTLAVAVLMAVWWISEALPLAVTSLIPVILFPSLGILSGEDVAGSYFNSTILLFLGGFLLALALEKWNLHKRIALFIISHIGGSASVLILSFMLSSAIISMFISNTATAVMLLPVALSVIYKMEEEASLKEKKFASALLIAIAYSCSIGGIATLIGTPPNLVFHRVYLITFPNAPQISFAQWMVFGLPLSIIMLFLTWLLLTKFYFKGIRNVKIDRSIIQQEYKALGKTSFEEKVSLSVLVIAIILWIFRTDINLEGFVVPGWSNLFGNPKMIDDGTIGIFIAFILFLIPSKSQKGSKILDVLAFAKVPWGILILFGGGFALAEAFHKSGLSLEIGLHLSLLNGLSEFWLLVVIVATITFLTEFTSNTAIANTMLPIIASMAIATHTNPLYLMIPAAIASSFAFMMPVATPPNAIVFGSGRIKIMDMVKVGFLMNIISIIVLSLMFKFFGSIVFGN